jgi:hypothetical protein
MTKLVAGESRNSHVRWYDDDEPASMYTAKYELELYTVVRGKTWNHENHLTSLISLESSAYKMTKWSVEFSEHLANVCR